LKERFRLGVLSNIDRDLFAGTCRHFSVNFDFVITAEEVKSYKPAPGHFRTLFDHHASKNQVVHVAQSLYHDGAPAESFGLPFVWINRYGQKNDTAVKPSLEFPELRALAEVACPSRSARP
jgi:2-haloacid dehalogenase